MSWTLTKKLDSFAGPGEISEEEGGELDSHEEVRLSFAGPGDIKGGRWCWTLKLVQTKRSRAGRWSWAKKAGLLLLRLPVFQQQCYGHCLHFVTLLRTTLETAIA